MCRPAVLWLPSAVASLDSLFPRFPPATGPERRIGRESSSHPVRQMRAPNALIGECPSLQPHNERSTYERTFVARHSWLGGRVVTDARRSERLSHFSLAGNLGARSARLAYLSSGARSIQAVRGGSESKHAPVQGPRAHADGGDLRASSHRRPRFATSGASRRGVPIIRIAAAPSYPPCGGCFGDAASG